MAVSARFVSILCVAAALAACEHVKSENPLSPTIAGPLPNVSMTPPQPVEPSNGKTILDTEQPLVLVMVNPTSSSPRPFATDVQIAADPQFSSVVVTRTGISPGGDGKTRISVGDKLQAGRTYYWRGLANDGANVSGWSTAASFSVVLPVVFGPPDPVTPVGNDRVGTMTPEFRLRNAPASGPFGALFYQVQVSRDANFTNVFTNADVAQGGGGETRYTMPSLPVPDAQYFWRARIYDSKNVGPWSRVETFRSPHPTAPGPGPTPGPGIPAGSCALPDPAAIVNCISDKYPNQRRAGVSSGERVANMEFIRDRIIEAGKCAGFNFGYNLKRGGPELSIDFLAWRTGGDDIGVDIAFDYDNTSTTLRLQWAPVGPGAFWTPGPSAPCGS
jgi:hypothetical protein